MNLKFVLSVMLVGLLTVSASFAQSGTRVPTEGGQAAAAAVIEEASPVEAGTPAPMVQQAPMVHQAPMASSVVSGGCNDCNSSGTMAAPAVSYGGCSGCNSGYAAPVVSNYAAPATSYSSGCSSCGSGYSSFPSYTGYGQNYGTYSSGCCNTTGWGNYGGYWNRGFSRPSWFSRRSCGGGCGY